MIMGGRSRINKGSKILNDTLKNLRYLKNYLQHLTTHFFLKKFNQYLKKIIKI